MLSASDVVGMQSAVSDSLPETATVLSRQETADGIGGRTEQFVPTTTCLARVVAGSALAKEVAARLSAEATHVILLPAGVDVAPGDRVQIGEQLFHVIEGTTEQTWDIARRISVQEL
jgi:head-tail adaptor